MKRYNIVLILSAAVIIGFSVGCFSGSKPEKKSIDLPRFTAEYVTLVETYEAECYADSTGYTGWSKIDTVWMHREPTLFGFGEYLEKELKK